VTSVRSPNAGIGGRTQQAGTLVAATVMPITFQPTLMPRSALDQALVTGMSLGVSAALTGLAAGERRFAAAIGALYGLLRRVDHRIEQAAEQIEAAFEDPPTSRLVSGGPGSGVAWETLSRQGRRNVATVLGAEAIEAVMGEPATTSWPPSSGPCAPPSWSANGCWTRPRPPRTRTLRPAGPGPAPRTRRPGQSRSGERRRASPAPPGRSR
jgi:hypothetical protein